MPWESKACSFLGLDTCPFYNLHGCWIHGDTRPVIVSILSKNSNCKKTLRITSPMLLLEVFMPKTMMTIIVLVLSVTSRLTINRQHRTILVGWFTAMRSSPLNESLLLSLKLAASLTSPPMKSSHAIPELTLRIRISAQTRP